MNPGLWWLVQNLVSVAVLIVFVSIACRALRNRPAWRHALWLVVLIKLMTPPVVSWPWSVNEIADRFRPITSASEIAEISMEPVAPGADTESVDLIATSHTPLLGEESVWTESPAATPLVFEDSVHSMIEVEPTPVAPSELLTERRIHSLQLLLAGLWIGGGAIVLATQLFRIRRQSRVVSRGTSAPQPLVEEMERISEKLKVRKISATVVPAIAAPFLWCLGRLRLIWPEALTTDKELSRSRGIIAHELAHVRRRDHWVAWLELAAGVIWWWNPLFWFVRRRLRESAEMSCDAMALSVVDDRREYAELFLELSSTYKTGEPAPVLGVSTGTPSSFERRLAMIFSDRVSSKLSVWGILLVSCLAAIALPNLMLAQVNSDSVDPTKTEGVPTENSTGVSFLEQIPIIGKQFTNQPVEQDKEADFELEFRPTITESGQYGLVVEPRKTSPDPLIPLEGKASNPAPDSSEETTTGADPTATLPISEKSLAGGWTLIESNINNAVLGPNFEEYFWEFDMQNQKVKTAWKIGGQADWGVREQVGQHENRFTIDTTQSPPHLTIYGDNMLILAIYELNGDQLKISYFGRSQAARPKSFEDERRDAGNLFTYVLKKFEPNEDASSSLGTENSFRVEKVPGSALDRRSVSTSEMRVKESYRGGSTGTSKNSSGPLPSLDVSPVEEERQLQTKLLQLDVQAAEAACESARKKSETLDKLSERDRGAVPRSRVDEAHAELRQKQIQLERAKTVLSLFELQAQRERERAAQAENLLERRRDGSRSRDGGSDRGSEDLLSDPIKR